MTAPEPQPAEIRFFTNHAGVEQVAWESDVPGMWIIPGSPVTKLAPAGSGTAQLIEETGTRYLPNPAVLDLDAHRAVAEAAIWGLADRGWNGRGVVLDLLAAIRDELELSLGREHTTGQHVGGVEPGCGLCEREHAEAQDEDEAHARNAAMDADEDEAHALNAAHDTQEVAA